MVKAKVWNVRRPSRVWFGTLELFWLDSALPIRAAPANPPQLEVLMFVNQSDVTMNGKRLWLWLWMWLWFFLLE